jgi:hypothetical protein
MSSSDKQVLSVLSSASFESTSEVLVTVIQVSLFKLHL